MRVETKAIEFQKQRRGGPTEGFPELPEIPSGGDSEQDFFDLENDNAFRGYRDRPLRCFVLA